MVHASNADFGSVITDTFVVDPSTKTFKKHTVVNEYDYGW